MTTIFNPALKAMVRSTAPSFVWPGTQIGLALLYSAPTLDPTLELPAQLASYLALPGVQEAVCPGYTRNTVAPSISTTGTVTYVILGNDFFLNNTAPVFVQAGIWYLVGTYGGYVNPWIMISDDMFGNVVSPGARITVRPLPLTAIRALFSYAPRGDTVDISAGSIIQSPGAVPWETSRTQHVYMLPQRINWVPNPSFEDVGRFGWRSNGIITRTMGGVDRLANYYASVSNGGGGQTVLESIPIPKRGVYRFSAYIKAPPTGGTLAYLALGCLDEFYIEQLEVSGSTLSLVDSWKRFDVLLKMPDDTTAVIPRVVANGAFDIDMVLLENTVTLHDYFDGDAATSVAGDFSWQGPQSRSYSFWYNNRYVTGARLFGAYTNGQVSLPSLVSGWMPQETAISTHWDVLSELDSKHPLKDWPSRRINPAMGARTAIGTSATIGGRLKLSPLNMTGTSGGASSPVGTL